MRFRFTVILLTFSLFVITAAEKPEAPLRRNISLGFLDDRTGLSFIGYSYNVIQKPQDEIYAGVGTLLAAFTASAGWKHSYALSGSSFYHTAGIQALAAMGGDKVLGIVSLGYDKRFGERWSLRLGGLAFLTFDQREPVTSFPFINLNYRF